MNRMHFICFGSSLDVVLDDDDSAANLKEVTPLSGCLHSLLLEFFFLLQKCFTAVHSQIVITLSSLDMLIV